VRPTQPRRRAELAQHGSEVRRKARGVTATPSLASTCRFHFGQFCRLTPLRRRTRADQARAAQASPEASRQRMTTWSASIVRVRRSFVAIQQRPHHYLRDLSRAISHSSLHSAAPGHPESSWDRASMARLQAARRFTATGLEPEESMVPAGSTALGKDSERLGTRRPVGRASPTVEVGAKRMAGGWPCSVLWQPGLDQGLQAYSAPNR
jgi:hypothetical protein